MSAILPSKAIRAKYCENRYLIAECVAMVIATIPRMVARPGNYLDVLEGKVSKIMPMQMSKAPS